MNSIQNTTIGIELYIFRLLFAILRPIRRKYNLSINLILTLNSCYLVSKLMKEQFYMSDVCKFNKYYSLLVIKRYFSILSLRGFISPVNPDDYRVLYKITEQGTQVIKEIQQYYDKELYTFLNKYNIDL